MTAFRFSFFDLCGRFGTPPAEGMLDIESEKWYAEFEQNLEENYAYKDIFCQTCAAGACLG